MSNRDTLIKQEQEKLDNLIRRMDKALLKIHKDLTNRELQIKKARAACLPEAYGDLVSAQAAKNEGIMRSKRLEQSRDELYKTRIEVLCTDERGTQEEDIKIGLHSFVYGSDVFIMSWKMPVSRHYLLDNAAVDFENVVKEKDGTRYRAYYELQKKRNVTLDFDEITEVVPVFPIVDEEDEGIIADEFLKELLKRRSEKEFQNIVFSIQKQQGEIIQAPFQENMIVQGCAGSGKSMIMLHRLPIVLYDNPNSLNRGNLYIITPSLTYIQMANNMMIDLEIDDLNMGTLNQYYDHVLALYNVPSGAYGKMKAAAHLTESVMRYVYSHTFIDDICRQMEEEISSHCVNYSGWCSALQLKKPEKISDKSETYYRQIQNEILEGQKIQNELYARQRQFHTVLRDVVRGFEELSNLLTTRKTAVVNGIRKQITQTQKELELLHDEISQIDEEENSVAYENRKISIKARADKLNNLHEALEIIQMDDEYFEKLRAIADRDIKKMMRRLKGYNKEFSRMKNGDLYGIYNLKEYISDFFNAAKYTLLKYGDVYSEYPVNPVGITEHLKKMNSSVNRFRQYRSQWLAYEDSELLNNTISYYTKLLENMVPLIYLKQMRELNADVDKSGNPYALPCSPYMYLQIVYHFKGCHNEQKESLITIDEAQNLMPEELRLIRAVNNDRVVLNLFGDVKQHMEGSKGVDTWKSFERIVPFKKYNMLENYRNARQVTNYCNKRFGLNMRAINLDGKGVHIIPGEIGFEQTLRRLFMRPQNPGLSCIIVRNRQEAEEILALVPEYANRIQKLAIEPRELHKNRWNLMTVEQTKGLEFETVVAVSGRMSENEKYVAYTRALDELYVFDAEMSLSGYGRDDSVPKGPEKVPAQEKRAGTRRKRVKRMADED